MFVFHTMLLIACSKEDAKDDSAKEDAESIENLDLSQVLNAQQSLAGIVNSETQLFGGISAEGQVGDIKIYNNQVQFIIQRLCNDSNYYLEYGGGIIDADIIGNERRVGYDLIDDYGLMIGFGRVVEYSTLEIINDGQNGEPAHIRATGIGVPFNLLQGALENFDMVEEFDMSITTDYILEPNTSLLQVRSTVTWLDDPIPLEMGSFFMVAKDIAEVWNPGGGRLQSGNNTWKGLLSKDNQLALGLFSEDQNFGTSLTQEILEGLGPIIGGMYPTQTVEEDETYTFTQYVGVGSDFSIMTEDWYQKQGVETKTYQGKVLDENGAGIFGARVNILQDGIPINMVITDESGAWEIQMPEEEYEIVATAQSEGVFYDVELQNGHVSPYQSPEIKQKTVSLYDDQDSEIKKMADGYGFSTIESMGQDLFLNSPMHIQIQNPDGIPSVIQLQRSSEDYSDIGISDDLGIYPTTIYAYIRDENMSIFVPKGEYDVLVHRSVQWEIQQETISSEEETIEIQLERAYETDLISIDSHTHSSPSGDGKLSMEQRLITHAAHQIDVHISTDHDHMVDYQPTLDALGLQNHLSTFIGVEVSPVLRGHVNMFPATIGEGINGGVVPWWHQDQNTSELYAKMREVLGEDGIIQPNHPVGSSGMLSYADYDLQTGSVLESHFSSDFQAMEVLNDGEYEAFFPYYLDLVSRGFVVTPTGVSDSHSHTGGVGENRTYLAIDPSKPLIEGLTEAIRAQKVSLSRGPLITVTTQEHWATGMQSVILQPANIEIDVLSPSWMQIDSIEVWKDTEMVEEIPWENTKIQYSAQTDEDAVFHFVAKGNTSMSPVYSHRPWSLSGPVYIDAEGDGWQSTKNPVQP